MERRNQKKLMLINYLTLKKRLSSFKTKLIKLTNREREFQVRDLTEKNQEITQRNQFLKMNSKNNLTKRDWEEKQLLFKYIHFLQPTLERLVVPIGHHGWYEVAGKDINIGIRVVVGSGRSQPLQPGIDYDVI